MNLIELIALLRRKWLVFVIVVIATLIAAIVFVGLQQPTVHITQLYSVALRNSPTTNSFDVTRVNDDFARSIAGWLQSPSLGAKIGELSGASVDISGAAQAKQNLLVELRIADPADIDAVATAANNILQQEVEAYNATSTYIFTLEKRTQDVATSNRGLPETLAAALLGGMLLSVTWILAASYFGGRVSSTHEAEELLGVSAASIFHSPTDPARAFFAELVKKNNQLASADSSIEQVIKQLDGNQKNSELPVDIGRIAHDKDLLLVVRLDHTRVSTLRQLRAMHSGTITLAIWG